MLKKHSRNKFSWVFFPLLHLTKCHPDFSACAFPALRSLPGCRKWYTWREPSARARKRCQRLFILSPVGRGQGTMRPQFAPVDPSCLYSATSCCRAPCNSFLFVFFLTTWSCGYARVEELLCIPNKERRAWYMAGATGYGEKQMNYKQPGLEISE